MRPAPAFAPRPLAFNATCLYIAAYLLTIMVHELGHALLSAGLGGRPILYSTSVVNANDAALSATAHVLIAAAGPLVSLLQGLALLQLVRRSRVAGAGRLLALYLGVFGVINFLGYLVIAPFVAGGDTGQIMRILRVPAGVQWAVAAAALVVLIVVVRRTAGLFLSTLPAGVQADPTARTGALRALILWPWLLGSVVLVLLALPAPHPAVVANMFMSPMALRGAYAAGQRLPVVAPRPSSGALLRSQWLLLAAGLGLAGAFRLLGQGVAW